jgi:phytanoyl-CoA hydroxylase
MLSEKQINAYKKNGYLVVEDVIPPETLKILQDVTDAFVEGAKNVTEHNETYDLADDHSKENPKLRRLKNPHLIHKEYEALTRDPCILDLVSQLLGNNLRRDHTKLNFKAANGGEAIEWHQDWAFYPHTNDDIVEVSIFLDDCKEENGPS